MLYSIVAMLVIILDQAVKYWVTNHLMGYDIVTFIPGVISLVSVFNDGAAFGMFSGSGARVYFIIITAVFTIAVILALVTNFISGRIARWSLVMITAGGLANCIDRVIYGYVVDMFKVELFNFAVFNVADIFITVFGIILVLAIIFEKDHVNDDEEEEEYYEDEDEEDRPRRKKLLSKLRRRDEEEDEEYEEELPPVRAPKAQRPARKEKSRYEQEYEQFRSEQPQRPDSSRSHIKPAAVADPFAEWEKANAKVESQRSGSFAAKAMGVEQPAAPSVRRSAAPVRQPAEEAAKPVVKPQRPVAQEQEAQPAARPAQAPVQPKAPAKAADDFDLDDILAEFK